MRERFSPIGLGASVVVTGVLVGLVTAVAKSGECRTSAGLGSVPSREAPKAHAVVYEECGDQVALVAAVVFDFPDLPPRQGTSDRIEALVDELRDSLGDDFRGSRPGLSVLGRGVLQIVADAEGERVKVRYADFDTEPMTLVDLALDQDSESVQTIHVDLSDYPMIPRIETGTVTRPPEADPADAGVILRSWAPAAGRFRDLRR